LTWLLLAVAIALEVTATSCLRSAGQGNLPAIAVVIVGYSSALALVAQVAQRFEIGIVYAIWSAAGTALVAIIGVVLLGEGVTAAKVAGLALVIAGVVVLNLAATSA
jgi:small multidrug resistance pump